MVVILRKMFSEAKRWYNIHPYCCKKPKKKKEKKLVEMAAIGVNSKGRRWNKLKKETENPS